MADDPSIKPRMATKYSQPDSSNPSTQGKPAPSEAEQEGSTSATQTSEKRVCIRNFKPRKRYPQARNIKLNFPRKILPKLTFCNIELITSRSGESSNIYRDKDNQSPPVLTEPQSQKMSETGSEIIELGDDPDQSMPSLNIESPCASVLNESEQDVVPASTPPDLEDDDTMELPVESATPKSRLAWLSEEDSDGSVGCLDVDPAVTNDGSALAANERPVDLGSKTSQSLTSEVLQEDCIVLTPLPPPLMPITDDSGNQDSMDQDSFSDEPVSQCFEEEVITTEVCDVVPLSTSPVAQTNSGMILLDFRTMSLDELRNSERELKNKISSLSQEIAKSTTSLCEQEKTLYAMQEVWEKTSADVAVKTEVVNRFTAKAVKLRMLIGAKNERVLALLAARNEAEILLLRSEIYYKDLELAHLKARLVALTDSNSTGPTELRAKITSKREERMAAILDEKQTKTRTFEEAKEAHRKAELEELKLRDALKTVFQQLNQAKQINETASLKAKNVQNGMEQLRGSIQRSREEMDAMKLDIFDAQDHLIQVESVRRRKELQLEREKMMSSRNIVLSSTNSHTSSSQLSLQSGSPSDNLIVANNSVRKIKRMQSSHSSMVVVEHSSQSESRSPPSQHGTSEHIVVHTSYDLNIRTTQIFPSSSATP